MDASGFTKKRWRVLFLYSVINLCVGSLYAWSVFAVPMEVQLQVNSLSVIYTIAVSVGPVTMILGGYLQKKMETRRLLSISGLVFGAGMILSGFAANLGLLILTYGLGCGLGAGLAYGCTVGNAVRLFPDRRGLAGGLAAAMYGGSAVLVPPIANALITWSGVNNAFRALGVAFLLIICLASRFVVECPPDFIPDGWRPPTEQKQKQREKDWRQMVSTPIFYVMLFLLMCGAISGTMTMSQAASIATNLAGMSATLAATMVSILALFNATGRAVAGMISDRIGRVNTLLTMLVLSLVGIYLLGTTGSGEYSKFAVGISLVGAGFGTFLGVFPGFTADQFGQQHQNINYGVMFIGFSMAGIIGPGIASYAYIQVGSYSPAFIAASVLNCLGIILSLLYKLVSD